MKNKKGFTLIELLVCITILGIIMGMSIPVIRNITVKNSATKYSSYLDTVVHAAKLYIDSYGEDIFGYNESGCGYVSFEDLLDHNLIKDYNADGITCNTKSTFVQVTKYEDSYSYKGYLGCANKHDVNNLIYTLPNNGEENVQDSVTCAGVDSTTTLSVSVSPNGYDLVDKNYVNAKIYINGRNGITRQFDLMYKWTTDSEDLTTTGMQRATFNVPTEAAQRINLQNGSVITAESSYISTPLGDSGNMYLIVQSFNLRDLSGATWINNGSNYAVFGPFIIDNTPPEFNSNSKVISSNSLYNMNIPKLSLNVIDNMSQISDMKMCVSYDDYCYDWEPYDPVKVLPEIPNFQYDGSSYNVYVTISDAASNIAMKQFVYESYVKCSSKEPSAEWPGCPSCGSSSTVIEKRPMKDMYLGVTCPSDERIITCNNLVGCCTDTRIECGNWSDYSKACYAKCGGWSNPNKICTVQCGNAYRTRTRTCKKYSNIDNSLCGNVTDKEMTEESIACQLPGCAPQISDQKYLTITCDTEESFVTSRTCDVIFDREMIMNTTSQFGYSYGSCATIDNVKPRVVFYKKYNNSSSTLCNWSTSCSFTSSNQDFVFKMRNETGLNYSIKGYEATYNVTIKR